MKAKEYDVAAFKERKRQEIQEISEQLETGVRELMTSERYREFLDAMAQFHNYSLNNSILIALQRPDASQVASYKTWEKLGRHVNRGEKGIKVLVPTPVKVQKQQENKLKGEDPEEERKIMRYKVGHVFDVSQTEGEPLPTLGVSELTGSYEGYEKFMAAIREVSPVPIKFADIQGGAKGYFDRNAREIVVQTGMSEAQTMKTAVHEVTHSMLHSREAIRQKERPTDRRSMEVEAESVAYIVAKYYGLNTADYTFGYVSSWSSGRDLKELKRSMETIRSTAGELIDGIYEKMMEKERIMEHSEKEIAIYQINDLAPVHLRFQGMKELKEMGIDPEHLPYTCVYEGKIAEETTLDDVFTTFNMDHPDGYKGHSLSVGDVIVVKDHTGDQRGFYVDTFGFSELTQEQREAITADKSRDHDQKENKERRKTK